MLESLVEGDDSAGRSREGECATGTADGAV